MRTILQPVETATELRLKIVHLRMRFIQRTNLSPNEEESLLAQIEELSSALRKLEKPLPKGDPADRRWSKRIQLQVPCRYLARRIPDPERLDEKGWKEMPPPSASEWKSARGGEVVNVSRGGLLLATTESIWPDMLLWIQMEPGSGGERAPKPFAVRSTIARSVFEGKRYLVGLEWTALTDAQHKELEEFLNVWEERSDGAVHGGEVKYSEKRRHPRLPLTLPIRFIIVRLPRLSSFAGKAKAPVIGHKAGETQNLSRGGMLFVTDVPVIHGSTISLEIPHPERDRPVLRVRGDVVRVFRHHTKLAIGVRFTDPTEIDPDSVSSALSRAR